MLDTINLDFGRRTVPVILQSEAAECGLACLAMVACHRGYRTDLRTLRSRHGVSLQGATIGDIVGWAAHMQLIARPFRIEPEELPQLAMPCILHWDLNHFVTLVAATRRGLVIHDPAVGVRKLSYEDAGPHLSGVALELLPGPQFTQADERRRIKLTALIGARIEGLWASAGKVVLIGLALEALGILAPIINQWITDEAISAGDRDMLTTLSGAALLLVLTQAGLSQARGWTLLYLSTHLSVQWSASVFTHLLRLPVSWFERRHLGDVDSRFGAAGTIQSKLTGTFISGVLDGVMALATLAMMLLYSWSMSLVVLGAVVLYALLRAIFYRPLRNAGAEAAMLGAQERSCFLETVRAIQAIKLSGRTLDRRTRWLNLRVESTNRSVRQQRLGLWSQTLHMGVTGIAGVLLFRLGAGLVMDGHGAMSVGQLLAFVSYSGQFGMRTRALVDNLFDLLMLSVACDRLADIVLEAPEHEGADYPGIAALPARIELVNVSFRYAPNLPWVLRGVNLAIEPGESVAIVGASGGGKTTLIKLLLGTLTPTEGEIRYGGVPLRQLGLRAYRSVLGTVMQQDDLLAGSVRENLCGFDPQPDDKRLASCAKLAAIDADIEAMPMRYQTLVGDMGASLSGGQKQRLLLARALYKRPKMLVLDEATSALDVPLEARVTAMVARMGLTRIIVAHRPETIRSARRVVVLAGGMLMPSTAPAEA